MAGQPRTLAMIGELERLAGEAGCTVLEYLVDRVASGGSLTEVAAEIHGRQVYCSRSMLSSYANSLPSGKEALREARYEGAHALVEGAHKPLDEAVTMTGVARAKALVELVMFRARAQNRADYGEEKQQINLTVSVQSLHLDALRRRALTDAERRQEIPDADYEVIEAAPEAGSDLRLARGTDVTEPAPVPKPNDLNDLLS